MNGVLGIVGRWLTTIKQVRSGSTDTDLKIRQRRLLRFQQTYFDEDGQCLGECESEQQSE
jgi:hypothetical protein